MLKVHQPGLLPPIPHYLRELESYLLQAELRSLSDLLHASLFVDARYETRFSILKEDGVREEDLSSLDLVTVREEPLDKLTKDDARVLKQLHVQLFLQL